MLKLPLDNHATLYLFKNKALVSNIRAGRKAKLVVSMIDRLACTLPKYAIFHMLVLGSLMRMHLPTPSLGISAPRLVKTIISRRTVFF